MKKIFLSLGIASMLLLSCQRNENPPEFNKRENIPLTQVEHEIAARSNVFAFEFFKTIIKNEEKENAFVSPLSASIALSMIANGAEESTLEEIKATLGFTAHSTEEVNAYYKKLAKGLLTVDNTATLGVANSIWVRKDFAVKQSFTDVNKEAYNAEIKTLDFSSAQATETINQWCSDRTNKRITQILDDIDPNAQMLLINALYFKGIWTSKFDKRSTTSDDFTATSRQTDKVDMMHQECATPYTKDEGLQIVELPYGNEAFSMVILLPEEEKSLDNVIDQMNPENWKKWMEHLSTQNIDLKLPKFKLEYNRQLNEDLKAMGMRVPFSQEANFGKMADAKLAIGLVKQDTFVEVNEEGTEAAATTVVGMYGTAAPGKSQVIPFHVNRPFVCVIKEKSTGTILFMGKIGSVKSDTY